MPGRFLTTLYDLEVDGTKHRVIPRDFQLDPVRDFPIHVDFMRLAEGARHPRQRRRCTSSMPTSRPA